MNKVTNNAYSLLHKDVIALVIITFTIFAIKAIFVVLNSSGPTISDELLNKFNARAIFEGQKYAIALYPPAYPLALTPAFFFKYWYEGMLIINAFWSSLIVPATWLLARAAGVRQSLLAALLVGLLPMHAIYPNVLRSENLYVPLFVLAVALALRGGKAGNIEALVFGFVLGITHLTKYLFLPALPLLVVAWLYSRSKYNPDVPSASLLQQYYPALFVLLSYGLVIAIWLIYGYASGFGLSEMFGFGISGHIAKAATVESLLMWVAAYSSYAILAWLPVWGIITIWVSQLSSKSWRINLESRHWFFLVLVLLLLGCYWLLAVQHSFGAEYNYPVPQRLIGRYLMPLSPIMLVLGVWVLERITEAMLCFGRFRALISAGVLIGFSSVAWWILFNNSIWKVTPWFANSEQGVPDVIAVVSPLMYLLAITITLLPIVFFYFRKADVRLLVLPLAVLMLISLISDAKRMLPLQFGRHFRELAAVGTILSRQGDTIHVLYDGDAQQLRLFQESMLFWELKQNQLSVEASLYEEGKKNASFSFPILHTSVMSIL